MKRLGDYTSWKFPDCGKIFIPSTPQRTILLTGDDGEIQAVATIDTYFAFLAIYRGI
jgi:hypothetical protein